ncbi:SDR family oxidoreductase [Klenkia terrae]|uniref:SDR family oxidoreductase n=1 Tax=Klenkia terrae TaxID=1052259 RepID=UPI001CD8B81B|nr:SDR family oxidoreductase [Klenkia terrae]
MHVFITGASGWIGSALVPELLSAGHRVTGLARSDDSARALTAAGADVLRGSLDDLDVLRTGAQRADGVVHLAFKHDLAFTGQGAQAASADREAVQAFVDALAGTDKPLVIASGALGVTPGRTATEDDGRTVEGDPQGVLARHHTAQLTLEAADRGVRSVVVRLSPTVHAEGDTGFIPALVTTARTTGTSAYVDEGTTRWPAVHRADASTLFRLAVEQAPAGSVLHAVAEEGIPTREIAEAIGRALDLPVTSLPAADAEAHFGFLGSVLGLDSPTSSDRTRALLGWTPTHPTLVEDIDAGRYTR